MSVAIETPAPSINDALPSSFYIPPHTTEEDDSTIASFHAGIEQMRMSKKNYEEGYRCVLKKTQPHTHSKKAKPYLLEYFTTKNVSGQPIRNARTGYLYSQYHVGHLTECLFFKTQLSTKESYEAQQFSMRQFSHKSKYTYSPSSPNKTEPELLFYDCPEEYETHHKITLSQELKDQWRARYERLLRHFEKTKRGVHSENKDSHIQILSSSSKSSVAPSPPLPVEIDTSKKRPPSPEGPPPGYVARL